MKNFVKRIISVVSVLLLIFMFASCNKKTENGESCVVQFDLNPSIEFCVDEEGKVISVTCLNDDGAELISGQVFIGENIENAAKKFIELAKEHGYIISEKAGEAKDQINIAISGAKANADSIYNSINSKVEKVISDAKLNVELHKEYLSKEKLKEKLNDCLSGIDTSNLTEEEIAKALSDCRKQIEGITSPIMQDMYYILHNYEEILAEAKGLITEIEEGSKNVTIIESTAINLATATLKGLITSFESSIASFKTAFNDNFIDEDSDFQKNLKDYFDAKQEVLQARLNLVIAESEQAKATVVQTLATAKATLTTIETAYTLASTAAKDLLEVAKNACSFVVTSIKTSIESVKNSETCKKYFTQDGLKEEINKTMNSFTQTFKTTYEEALEEYTNAFSNKE